MAEGDAGFYGYFGGESGYGNGNAGPGSTGWGWGYGDGGAPNAVLDWGPAARGPSVLGAQLSANSNTIGRGLGILGALFGGPLGSAIGMGAGRGIGFLGQNMGQTSVPQGMSLSDMSALAETLGVPAAVTQGANEAQMQSILSDPGLWAGGAMMAASAPTLIDMLSGDSNGQGNQNVTDLVQGTDGIWQTNPYNDPRYGMYKNAAETQYNTAKNNLLSTLPAGGTLDRAIGNLNINKAANLTNYSGNLLQDLADKQMQMKLAEMGIDSSAANLNTQLEAQRRMQEDAQEAQMLSTLGYALASMF